MVALAVGEVFGIPPAAALQKMRSVTSVAGRYTQVERQGRQVRLLLAKNPAGWLETLEFWSPRRCRSLSPSTRRSRTAETSRLWDVV